MKKLATVAMIFAMGCGTILNADTKTAMLPPGATINGASGNVGLNQDQSYQVMYPDGRMCVIDSNISIGWAVADVLFTGLLGVVIDAVTGGWKTLDAGGCPGVALN